MRIDDAAVGVRAERAERPCDGEVDGGVFTTDTHARDEASGVEERHPARTVADCRRRPPRADQADTERHEDESASAPTVGGPTEDQCTRDFTGGLDRGHDTDRPSGHVRCALLRQEIRHRGDESDLQGVEDPRHAENDDLPGAKRGPPEPVEARRDDGSNYRVRFDFGVCDHGSPQPSEP